jgi:hypothetical protein
MPNSKGRTDTDWFPSSLHTLQARLNTVHIGTRKDQLITRFVLCPNKECGARYHMAQAVQLMVCQAQVWVRPAPNARTWTRQWCHTRLFRSVDCPVGQRQHSGPEHGQPSQKQPHVHQYEKDALNHRHVQEQEHGQEHKHEEEEEKEIEQQPLPEQLEEEEQKQQLPQPHAQRDPEHKQEQKREMEQPAQRKNKRKQTPSESGRRASKRLASNASARGVPRFTVAAPASAAAASAAASVHVPPARPDPHPAPPLSATAAAAAYSTDYVPESMYPYCGLIAPLKIMLMRKGFEEACTRHRWRGKPGGAHGRQGAYTWTGRRPRKPATEEHAHVTFIRILSMNHAYVHATMSRVQEATRMATLTMRATRCWMCTMVLYGVRLLLCLRMTAIH